VDWERGELGSKAGFGIGFCFHGCYIQRIQIGVLGVDPESEYGCRYVWCIACKCIVWRGRGSTDKTQAWVGS